MIKIYQVIFLEITPKKWKHIWNSFVNVNFSEEETKKADSQFTYVKNSVFLDFLPSTDDWACIQMISLFFLTENIVFQNIIERAVAMGVNLFWRGTVLFSVVYKGQLLGNPASTESIA